ncbi:hypothetical protein OPQ81_001683 [Rhizoctonia solani]|nr:hypothetical protein OPQ81_001683 [Rhizoctonia solani]
MNRMKKYHNPHHYLNEDSLRAVSRHDLANDLDGYDGLGGSNSSTDPAISRAISVLDEVLSPLANDFVGAIRGRKRKRGEPPVSIVNENQATGIRLVSQKPVLVTTAELVDSWPSQPKMHPSEDTNEEANERKRRAEQVAVEFEVIRKQSAVPYPSFKVDTSPNYKLKATWVPTAVAVVESPKPKPTRHLHLRMESGQLKTRNFKPKASLIVDARSGHIPPPKSQPDFSSNTFYYSDQSVGGKSVGYAWGYRGSFPRLVGSSGYLRDNMQKGLDILVADREVATKAKEVKIMSNEPRTSDHNTPL